MSNIIEIVPQNGRAWDFMGEYLGERVHCTDKKGRPIKSERIALTLTPLHTVVLKDGHLQIMRKDKL